MDLLPLTAGPLTMALDPHSGQLRYVRLGDFEVVRGVYGAVRDRNWDTIVPQVHELSVNAATDHFELSFVAECIRDDVRFQWRGRIAGSNAGRVQYSFSGRAGSAFLKNRIGLCLLHPILECAGRPCRVEHTDGTVSEGVFPHWISPHQPFKNIRATTHDVAPGIQARMIFDGETFEMEDQRNWTDASFKTYSTPLDLPFPVQIAAGERIEQAITIELVHSFRPGIETLLPRSSHKAVTRVSFDWQHARPRPSLGFSLPSRCEPVAESVIERLRAVGPDHVRVDLRLQHADWQARASESVDLAQRVGTQLEAALFVPAANGDVWQTCLDWLTAHRPLFARVLLFDWAADSTTPALAEAAARDLGPLGVPLAVGTDAYFAELNRDRPPVAPSSLVCYSINPQVHAFDNLTLVENLGGQRPTVDTAHHIFACPVVISPITLRPRFNPNATSPTAVDGQQGPESDERQPTGFAAAWTAGALAQLATHPNVASLTFFEAFGPGGIMDARANTYPVYRVFETVCGWPTLCSAETSCPLAIAAMGLPSRDGNRAALLANMSHTDRDVEIIWGSGHGTHLTLAPESVSMVGPGELS